MQTHIDQHEHRTILGLCMITTMFFTVCMIASTSALSAQPVKIQWHDYESRKLSFSQLQ